MDVNTTVVELVESRAALELEDRRELFGRELLNIKEQFTAWGTPYSSMAMVAIQDAVKREVRVRATLIWTALARALSSSRQALTPTTAQEAKDLISRVVQEHSSDLRGHLDSVARSGVGARLAVDKQDDALGAAFKAAFDRINSEVDFALLASTAAGSDALPQIVNIYQSQGIVQTGFQASASMTINLGGEEREEIKLALSAAREALERDTSVSDIEKRSAIELLDETVAEVEKDQPNRLKIRGGLQGVATTVQTLAAAPQVYGLIKGAAALVGLDLP